MINKNGKIIKLVAEICASWAHRSYRNAFMNLVNALSKEGYEVKYDVKMTPQIGSLEVFLNKENNERQRVFSKLNSGSKINEDTIPDIIEDIKNKLWSNLILISFKRTFFLCELIREKKLSNHVIEYSCSFKFFNYFY